jgi:hypothetical protein
VSGVDGFPLMQTLVPDLTTATAATTSNASAVQSTPALSKGSVIPLAPAASMLSSSSPKRGENYTIITFINISITFAECALTLQSRTAVHISYSVSL